MKKDIIEDFTRQFDTMVKSLKPEEASELLNQITLKVEVKQNKPKLPPNIMVFQTVAFLCATKLKPSSNKILMYFFSISMYENIISMDIQTLMDDLLMSKPTVINSINELTEHGIIARVKRISDKRRNEYMLNPFASWKGNSVARNVLIGKMTGNENPNQLSLFGEQPTQSVQREGQEIRKRKTIEIESIFEKEDEDLKTLHFEQEEEGNNV